MSIIDTRGNTIPQDWTKGTGCGHFALSKTPVFHDARGDNDACKCHTSYSGAAKRHGQRSVNFVYNVV